MAWSFEDETDEYADAVLDRLAIARAVVPALWPLEVANALLMGERRKRSTEADTIKWTGILKSLPIAIDGETNAHAWSDTLDLGARPQPHRLRRRVSGASDPPQSAAGDHRWKAQTRCENRRRRLVRCVLIPAPCARPESSAACLFRDRLFHHLPQHAVGAAVQGRQDLRHEHGHQVVARVDPESG